MAFKGKIAWITGASSGIGTALACAFAAEGTRLILSGRRVEALEELATRLDTDCLVLPFESTDWDVLPGIFAKAIGWQGHIDILVNNAGISQRSLAVDTAPAVYRRIIDIDLMAPIQLTQLVLPHMAERKSGHIVNISSVAGRVGVPLRTAYCAAKHGLAGYGDALRAETEKTFGLQVTNVFPGSIRTDVSRNALDSEGARRGVSDDAIDNGLPPDECARHILAGMEAGAREVIVAEGMEEMLANERHSDPDKVFAIVAAFGAQIAEQQDG